MSKLKNQKSKPKIFLFTADSKPELQNKIDNILKALHRHDLDLDDISYSVQMQQKKTLYKKVLVCTDKNHGIQELSDEDSLCVYSGKNDSHIEPKIIFMFPGQGLQYIHMGKELYIKELVFQATMNICFESVKNISKIDIKKILYPESNELNSAEELISLINISPIITFVFEYSLAKLLMSWNIMPIAMIGHSIGEYVAACLAGVFSLDEALKLVILRGKLMKKLPPGKMISVPLRLNALTPILPTSISIAADHGHSCIVSGSIDEINKFQNYLMDKHFICHSLNIQGAGHSQMLDGIINDFRDALKKIQLNSSKIPFISNVTGNWIKENEAKSPEYWVHQLKNTVKFNDGLRVLSRSFDAAAYLEVGPGNALTIMVSQKNMTKKRIRAFNLINNVYQTNKGILYLYVQLARLWIFGVTINWKLFH